MIFLKFYIAFALICSSVSYGQHTGAKVRISKAGLDYGAGLAVDLLEQRIVNLRIPDQSGSGFDLNNIRITRFEKPTADVTLNEGRGLTASLHNAAVTVEANWKYSVGKGWFKIRDSGRLTLSSSRFTISSALTIGRDDSGRPTAIASSCSCSIRGFDIKFHGGMSVVYNLFARLFEKKIREKLQDLTCDEVKKLINTNVREELASLNVDAPIDGGLHLDYRLSQSPLFTSQYLETSHVGEFFAPAVRYPGLPNESTLNIRAGEKMVTISISERLFNSGSYLLYKLGRFNFSQQIPGREVSDFLNIPYDRLNFKLAASEAPSVRISASELRCSLQASLQLFSGETASPSTSLLSFHLSLLVRIDVAIADGRITGRFIDVEPTVLDSSGLLSLPGEDVQGALRYLFGVVMPGLNEEAARGFPLPVLDFVGFRDLRLVKDEGVVSVSADVVSH